MLALWLYSMRIGFCCVLLPLCFEGMEGKALPSAEAAPGRACGLLHCLPGAVPRVSSGQPAGGEKCDHTGIRARQMVDYG